MYWRLETSKPLYDPSLFSKEVRKSWARLQRDNEIKLVVARLFQKHNLLSSPAFEALWKYPSTAQLSIEHEIIKETKYVPVLQETRGMTDFSS